MASNAHVVDGKGAMSSVLTGAFFSPATQQTVFAEQREERECEEHLRQLAGGDKGQYERLLRSGYSKERDNAVALIQEVERAKPGVYERLLCNHLNRRKASYHRSMEQRPEN
ncbi:MAG TPA: hypothetical protein VHZ04_01580 [Candidatus Paceibacterota bacterium]|jgi:hypothetical protein|nr:hypothetical protein [Candidatus Paceibacterota bacterium]